MLALIKSKFIFVDTEFLLKMYRINIYFRMTMLHNKYGRQCKTNINRKSCNSVPHYKKLLLGHGYGVVR